MEPDRLPLVRTRQTCLPTHIYITVSAMIKFRCFDDYNSFALAGKTRLQTCYTAGVTDGCSEKGSLVKTVDFLRVQTLCLNTFR